MTKEELQVQVKKIKSLRSFYRDQNNIGEAETARYYKRSSFLYRRFHSEEGAMHLPIEGNKPARHKEKLKSQLNQVQQLIENEKPKMILELGCGMGFNLIQLAEKNPLIRFTGMDITNHNLQIARSRSKGRNNIEFLKGNFDHLDSSPISEKKFDLVFGVETLCHSQNFPAFLENISTYLNPGGILVIFDGFKMPEKENNLSELEFEAYDQLCWGFSLGIFNELKDLKSCDSLELKETEDYSAGVLPNFKVFQRGALKAFKWHPLLKILQYLRLVPMAYFQQMAAGLFGPYFIENGFLSYKMAVLKKK